MLLQTIKHLEIDAIPALTKSRFHTQKQKCAEALPV